MRRILVCAMAMVMVAGCAAKPKQQPASTVETHASHAEIKPAKPLRAGERFAELKMARPFTPAPVKGTDEYRCFLVDPGLTQKTFITGSQFLPQNPDVVHHAIFFRVNPGDVAKAKSLDEKTDGDGWTCFGGTGISSGPDARQSGNSWIAAWAPGGDEVVLKESMGYQMEAGSQVVMQIHYNLLAGKGADQSGIRLRLTDDAATKPLQTTLLPGPVELPCTATESGPLCDREKAVLDVWSRFGAQAGQTVAGLSLLCSNGTPKPGQVQTCDHRVKEAGVIYAAAGHMHLLGRSIKIELNPGTPQARLLLDVQVYDFDNQGGKPLAEPVAIKAGDNLRVTCTHDASLRQQVPSLKTLEPRYVVWGEGTSDEMCLGILTWTRP